MLNTNLISLDFSITYYDSWPPTRYLDEESFYVILAALKSNNTLKKLNFSGNQIKFSNKEFVELFNYCYKLEYLNLCHNKLIHEIPDKIIDLITNNKDSNLKEVFIFDCQIKDYNINTFVKNVNSNCISEKLIKFDISKNSIIVDKNILIEGRSKSIILV